MLAPINSNRKPLNTKTPKNVKKVQWVVIRKEDTKITPINDPFRYQESGITRAPRLSPEKEEIKRNA